MYVVHSTGAKIEGSASISKVNEIVQQIFKDNTKAVKFEISPKFSQFICMIEFPDHLSCYNCKSRTGFSSKSAAKIDACLFAIEKFHEGGLLDDYLRLGYVHSSPKSPASSSYSEVEDILTCSGDGVVDSEGAYIVPSTGARVDLNGAVSRVNEIVQQYFRDGSKQVKDTYEEGTGITSSPTFKCLITLPAQLSAYNVDSRPGYQSKSDAKKAACIFVLKNMHSAGLLDDNLMLTTSLKHSQPEREQDEHPHTSFKNFVDQNQLGVCRLNKRTNVIDQRANRREFIIEAMINDQIIATGSSSESQLEASEDAVQKALEILLAPREPKRPAIMNRSVEEEAPRVKPLATIEKPQTHLPSSIRVPISLTSATLQSQASPAIRKPVVKAKAFDSTIESGSDSCSSDEFLEDEPKYTTRSGVTVVASKAYKRVVDIVRRVLSNSDYELEFNVQKKTHPENKAVYVKYAFNFPGDLSRFNCASKTFVKSLKEARDLASLVAIEKFYVGGLLDVSLELA